MLPVFKKNIFLFVISLIFCLWVPLYGNAAQNNDDIPLPARMVLYKANGFLENKQINKAIEVLESFRAKGEKGYRHHLISFTLGNCYLMQNTPSKAISLYQSALKEKRDFSTAWMNLAKCYHDLNQPMEAGRAFLKGYDTAEEKKAETLYYSAVSFLVAEKNKKALEVFERLLTLHKDQIRIEWKESLVQTYLACDQPRKALPYIEELAKKTTGKKKKQWQEVLLYQYISLNMKTKARDYAEWLTKQYPLEPKWWKALANLHLSENRYKKAVVALTAYGFLKPLSKQEKQLMADLYSSIGIPIKAADFYEDILLKKMDPEIVKRLVHSYLNLHNPQKALETVEKGLKHISDDKLLILKGQVLYEMERYREAITAFEKTGSKNPERGQAWLMIGYAAWHVDDIQKARRAFQNAAKYPKQRETAQKVLRRLEKLPSR